GGERFFRIELGSAAGGVDVNLLAGEVGDQIFAGVGAVGAAANDRDHVVEMVERGEIALENVFAVARLLQQISSPAADHIHPAIDELLDGINQSQLTRLAVDYGQQDHAEAFLHLRMLEQLVEHDLGLGSALQFDNDPHAVA